MTSYQIFPAIGVARLGDSTTEFYLPPTTTGGHPRACDAFGNPVQGQPVERFKSTTGEIKRQAAEFHVHAVDDEGRSEPIELCEDGDIVDIRWTVHLANKKATWYQFAELQGDLLLGPQNSYANQGVALRNPEVEDPAQRQRLIIDPGPRTLAETRKWVEFDEKSAGSYEFASFPPANISPFPISSLGRATMTDAHGLVVLGGLGHSGGLNSISTFAGANDYWDDIADGLVRATLRMRDGSTQTLDAWCVVGSPKFAPELVNISTWADIMVDTAVRMNGAEPELFDTATRSFKTSYRAVLERDVVPILRRMRGLQWVADVAPMVAYATFDFGLDDTSEQAKQRKLQWLARLRPTAQGQDPLPADPAHQKAFYDDGLFPLMPLQSGDNSVSNQDISKFASLTPTQYFLLSQWANNKFISDTQYPPIVAIDPLTAANTGNCVGYPCCPGIEVTWSVRNPAIYADLSCTRIAVQPPEDYRDTGLSSSRDETEGGGCQPGDLTKRMAIPWQADFFQCSVQTINFTNPNMNQPVGPNNGPDSSNLLPSLYAYWWPAQSPWTVYSGNTSADAQALDGQLALGQKVSYQRGINSFNANVIAWKYLGFVVNVVEDDERERYPFFVERERSLVQFQTGQVAVTEAGEVASTLPVRLVTTAQMAEYDLSFPVFFRNPTG